MARTTIVQITDDIDGSEGVETVSFGFRGTDYEIDLNAKNVAALEKAISKYLDAARKVPKTRSAARGGARGGSSGREDVAAIRVWAREHGFEVSDRGRIPAEIREAYAAG